MSEYDEVLTPVSRLSLIRGLNTCVEIESYEHYPIELFVIEEDI
jgi:hypothetical protein